MNIEIRTPKTDQEFNEYFQLRYDILRKPWGQPIESNKDELENSSIHLAAFFNGTVIGCARLQFNNPQEAQLRYMAVKEEHRQKGIGTLLLKESEMRAKKEKAQYLFLNARETALDFYKKNGYEIFEKGELLFGSIQHWKMKKDL